MAREGLAHQRRLTSWQIALLTRRGKASGRGIVGKLRANLEDALLAEGGEEAIAAFLSLREEMRGRILTKDECDLTIRVNWKSCLTRGLVEEALKRSAQWDVNCSLLVRYVLYLGFESLTKVWGPSPEVEGLTEKSLYPERVNAEWLDQIVLDAYAL